ncbi:hypothetical protein Val02_31380 [Virgisporangium aliadipatigenens]|uniref:Uncharacterized protein n=1 Tax=Virgisporangium aliadipatigenens TaxID=741659 RepID=A0A8J3YL08_9ACTN|nr:hypothetical protein [Virgisporangium aliadipatigenens]GIJ46252.1 hypothetical protein Val02_31380 [Virgisporangium aliadipatigenens]
MTLTQDPERRRDIAHVGRTYLRAAGPEALRRLVEATGASTVDEEAHLCTDPDGHELGRYRDVERYVADDHVNYLTADVPRTSDYLRDTLAGGDPARRRRLPRRRCAHRDGAAQARDQLDPRGTRQGTGVGAQDDRVLPHPRNPVVE